MPYPGTNSALWYDEFLGSGSLYYSHVLQGGDSLELYFVLGTVTHFVVNLLLLLAVNCGLRLPYGSGRCLLGALVASVFAVLCMLPQFVFLNLILWRMISLLVICLTAFGFNKSSVKHSFLFCLLRFALEGIGNHQVIWSVVLGTVCFCVFHAESRGYGYIPVSLSYCGRNVKLKALHDTGHNLRDPVTGRHVLVVDADIATLLTGLSAYQLHHPIQTMQEKSGLCLLPYHTVGNSNGILLAVNVKNATIGKRKMNAMVALCGEKLDMEGKFQGLIGGML